MRKTIGAYVLATIIGLAGMSGCDIAPRKQSSESTRSTYERIETKSDDAPTEEEEHTLERIVAKPISVIVACGNTRKINPGDKGYHNSDGGYYYARMGDLASTFEIDGKLILAQTEGECGILTRSAAFIDSAIKKGDTVELVVCRPEGGYYVHGVTAEGYAIDLE